MPQPIVQHVVIHSPNSTTTRHPPAWQIFPTSESRYSAKTAFDLGSAFVAHCNFTHSTHYYDATTLQAHPRSWNESMRVVHIFIWHSGRSPPAPERPPNAILLFFTLEPPVDFDFDSVKGYDGEVGYRRSATVRSPLIDPKEVTALGRELPFEPSARNSIGVWNDNCGGALRQPIVDALLSSGLRVHSYGDCRRNRPSSFGRLASREGIRECRTHRLMVSIQHTACDDYVNENLLDALRCGAIPIIARVQGVPDYRRLYGSFPHVDASRASWLENVRHIMSDNATYRAALRRGRWPFPPLPQRTADWHCRFHDINPRRRGRHERFEWPRCLICNGSRFHAEGFDGNGDFGHGRWLRPVNCPPHQLN